MSIIATALDRLADAVDKVRELTVRLVGFLADHLLADWRITWGALTALMIVLVVWKKMWRHVT